METFVDILHNLLVVVMLGLLLILIGSSLIWSINILFSLHIAYTWKTILASLVIITLLNARSQIKNFNNDKDE